MDDPHSNIHQKILISVSDKPAVEFKDPPPVPSAFPMKRKLTQKAIQQAHIDFMAKRYQNICCVVYNKTDMDAL